MKKRKNAVRKRGKKKTKAVLAGGTEKWWHAVVQLWRARGHNVVLDDVEENREHCLWEALQCWIRCEVQLWSIMIGRSEAEAETLVEDKRNKTLCVHWHLPIGVSSLTVRRPNTRHRKTQGPSDNYPDPQNL